MEGVGADRPLCPSEAGSMLTASVGSRRKSVIGRQLNADPLDPMRVSAKGNGSLLLGSFEIVTPRRSTTMTATTRQFETTASTATLFVSFELGEASWTLACATERMERPRKRT